MPRLLLALLIAVGLCAPATAQVWKLKKAKTGTAAKTPAKKTTKAKSTSRSSSIKKKKRSASKTRKVDLVPEETDSSETPDEPERDRAPDESDEPIIIQVEEID